MTDIAFNKIFKLPQVYDKIIYPSCFGIFTTIETDVGEVHGCIGNWNIDFTNLTDVQKIETIKSVTYSAMFRDSRNKPETINNPNTRIKIYFMNKPEKIRFGDVFDNENYGLIVSSPEGRRATFLPGVFGTIQSKNIKRDILHKAGINTNSVAFYSYKCVIYSDTFIDCIQKLCKSYRKLIYRFFNSNYGEFFPYSVRKNKTSYDKTQAVRNIATMGDLLSEPKYLTSETLSKIKRDLSYYDLETLPSLAGRAFLSRILNVCHKFNIKEAERDFELGQILIAYAQVCKMNTKNDLDDMLSEIEERENEINLIFRLNWQCQAVCASQKIDKQHLKRLYNIFTKWYNTYFHLNLETNYIVVAFEFLSFIKKCDDLDLDKLILKVFTVLATRFNPKLGLFRFTDDSYRIDITGHFLNAIK